MVKLPCRPRLATRRRFNAELLSPVESKDSNTRYFHIHKNDQLNEELVASWIKQASELPSDALF